MGDRRGPRCGRQKAFSRAHPLRRAFAPPLRPSDRSKVWLASILQEKRELPLHMRMWVRLVGGRVVRARHVVCDGPRVWVGVSLHSLNIASRELIREYDVAQLVVLGAVRVVGSVRAPSSHAPDERGGGSKTRCFWCRVSRVGEENKQKARSDPQRETRVPWDPKKKLRRAAPCRSQRFSSEAPLRMVCVVRQGHSPCGF